MTRKNQIYIKKIQKTFCVVALSVIGSALAVPGRAADIPQEYAEAVRKAQAGGSITFLQARGPAPAK
jgi:hypothetical protein